MEDDYAVLGVGPEATPSEVRAAYRRLVKRYHPDVHQGNPRIAQASSVRFTQITEAYLRIKEGHPNGPARGAPVAPGGRPAPPSHAGPIPSPPGQQVRRKPRSGIDPSIPFDWAGWGGKEGAQTSLGDDFARGSPYVALKVEREEGDGDVSAFLDLTVRESLLGVTKRVVLLDDEECRGCHGVGKVEARMLPCAACGGTGRREETHLQGAWKSIDRCSHCKGTGRVERTECDICDGKGKESRHDIVMVEVPPGSFPGKKLRLQGMGRWAAGRRARGDYFLTLALAEGPEAWHEGGAQHMAFPVPRTVMVQGGQIVVPSREGPRIVAVAAGTADGETLRLADAGPKVPPRGEVGPLVLHLRSVEDPGELPGGVSFGIPAFLRKAIPTEAGERTLAAWSAYLDSPTKAGFLIVTTLKLVFLTKENVEGIGMEWFCPVSQLALTPLELPDGVPRDRSALWAINIAGRRLFLRRTLAQIEKIHEMLRQLQLDAA